MESERAERILQAVAALPDADRQQLLDRLWQQYGPPPAPQQAALPLTFTTSELQGPADYEIVFDGGSQGNPGPAYGSFRLTRLADGRHDIVRLDWQREMTSNEAEYETLLAALQNLLARIERAGQQADQWSVEVRGDSTLVLRQIEGQWKAKDDRMYALCRRARELLASFKSHRLVLHGREETVRILGH